MMNPLEKPGYAACLSFAGPLKARVPLRSANDNAPGIASDTLLREALKHFARHGLGAAELARKNAERAFFTGNREEYRWWLEICRALDRRMAAAVAARAASAREG